MPEADPRPGLVVYRHIRRECLLLGKRTRCSVLFLTGHLRWCRRARLGRRNIYECSISRQRRPRPRPDNHTVWGQRRHHCRAGSGTFVPKPGESASRVHNLRWARLYFDHILGRNRGQLAIKSDKRSTFRRLYSGSKRSFSNRPSRSCKCLNSIGRILFSPVSILIIRNSLLNSLAPDLNDSNNKYWHLRPVPQRQDRARHRPGRRPAYRHPDRGPAVDGAPGGQHHALEAARARRAHLLRNPGRPSAGVAAAFVFGRGFALPAEDRGRIGRIHTRALARGTARKKCRPGRKRGEWSIGSLSSIQP